MKSIFLAYVNAINSGDLETAMSFIAADAQLLNSKYRPPTPCEGLELVRTYIQETVISQNARIYVRNITENADSVSAEVELQSDRIRKIGLNRICGFETFTIENSKIKGFDFSMNLADEQTKTFFDFVRTLEADRPKINHLPDNNSIHLAK